MSALDDLYAAFDEKSIGHLYHFTAISNIPSIRNHRGLFARSAHPELDIECVHCSDSLSRRQDERNGLDHYIHLSLHETHAMIDDAHQRLSAKGESLGVIKIDRSILESNEVLYCGDISNISGLKRHPIEECADLVRRLTPGKLKRAEILVPSFVPFRYFIDSWRWNGY